MSRIGQKDTQVLFLFLAFILFGLLLSEDTFLGNVFLAINRKSMAKQVSLC